MTIMLLMKVYQYVHYYSKFYHLQKKVRKSHFGKVRNKTCVLS